MSTDLRLHERANQISESSSSLEYAYTRKLEVSGRHGQRGGIKLQFKFGIFEAAGRGALHAIRIS